MSQSGSLADLLGAAVRVGTVRVGEVVGVFVNRGASRVIGLEVSSTSGFTRFLRWFAARRNGSIVTVESALVIVDDGAGYERLGATRIRDRASLLALRALPDGELGPSVPVSAGPAAGIGRR